MKHVIYAVAAGLCLISASAAYATPVKPTSDSYTLTLSSGAAPKGDKSYQGGGGTGAITIAAAGTPNGTYDAWDISGDLVAMSFTLKDSIGGQSPLTFNLNNNSFLTDPTATFQKGALTGISYQSTDISGEYLLNFDASNMTYSLTDQKLLSLDPVIDAGSISVSQPAAVTPEPSSLMLLGTGVLAGCGAMRRRLFA